ncbi:hypothetical protein TrCOL_g3679 [Triparma columacea]|uniref:Pyruvate kinase n=1 Tax=Triparma columacea TaxID=722753 RepID=A0A9W7GNW3_9STRA|nr:hypothetical protein TrCOL_g3679 [Triparma columacea]
MTCTLGPSSSSASVIQDLSDNGMSVSRLNFSHVPRGDYAYSSDIISNVRGCEGMHCRVLQRGYNMTAVLLDTKGPEIRTGVVEGYVSGEKNLYVELEDGKEVLVTTDERMREKVTSSTLYLDYKQIGSTVTPGDVLLLDDGLIGLEVTAVSDGKTGDDGEEYCEVNCIVKNGGALGSVKGVNIPNTTLQLPSMTEKDKEDILWGIRSNEIDIVAASFVRKASDVRTVKAYLERCISRAKADGDLKDGDDVVRPAIISKIENKEGVDNFEEILAESDGIMVARGDLGVEIPFADLLILQKKMVRLCNLAGKPVIVATQMLDSMQRNPRPTRAEVTDVGNAVLDGADCVMLSGESANGNYPVVAAKTMQTIVAMADDALDSRRGYSNIGQRRAEMYDAISKNASTLESICSAAVQMASQTDADIIIAISRKGSTVKSLAKFRPNVPIMAFVPTPSIGRRLILHRGVYPIVMSATATDDEHERVVEAVRTAKEIGWLKPNHRVVVVDAELWGLESTKVKTKANCIKIFTV